MEGRAQAMINVSQKQLSQVEYLIQQSIQGHHVLFDHETIKVILNKNTHRADPSVGSMSTQPEPHIEQAIEELITKPTLTEKRAFLNGLSRDIFEKVVCTYFNIVENNLFESSQVKH